MATVRLNTATIRGRLPKGRWHYHTIAKGVAIGYRRGPKAGKDGVWAVRYPAPAGSTSYYSQTNIGVADDGKGFPFHGRYDLPTLIAGRFGPVTLKERVSSCGGTLVIESSSDGAKLEMRIPLHGTGA